MAHKQSHHPKTSPTRDPHATPAAQPDPCAPEIQTLLDLHHTVGNHALAETLPFQPDLQRSFGRDLSTIAVHTGVSSLKQQRAAAATIGHTIFFAHPHPPKEIVAHETAHVLQNRNSTHLHDYHTLAPQGGNAETEADRASDATTHGQSARVTGTRGGAIAHWNLFGKKAKKPDINFVRATPMTPEQQGNAPSARDLETQRDTQIKQNLDTFESNAHPEITLPSNPTFQPLTMGDAGLSRSYWAKQNDQTTGIFKPAKQEFDTSNSGGYKKGGGAIREALGYELSQKLGGNVPKTRLMSGHSQKFNQVGRLNKRTESEKYDSSPTQVGSYQQLAQNTTSLSSYLIDRRESEDAKSPNLDPDSLQKMAMQDIMTLNTDRHEGNVLVDPSGKLIPIDHGQILPGNEMAGAKLGQQSLNKTYWAWQRLKGAEKQFSHKNKRLISGINAKSLVNDLRTQTDARAKAAGMKDSTVTDRDWLNLKLSTRTLQKAVRAGLSPAQIGGLYTANAGLTGGEAEYEKDHPGELAPTRSTGELSQFLGGSGKITDDAEYTTGWKSAADAGLKRVLGEEGYQKFLQREALRKRNKALRKQQAQPQTAPTQPPPTTAQEPAVNPHLQPATTETANKTTPPTGGFFGNIGKFLANLNPFKKRDNK